MNSKNLLNFRLVFQSLIPDEIKVCFDHDILVQRCQLSGFYEGSCKVDCICPNSWIHAITYSRDRGFFVLADNLIHIDELGNSLAARIIQVIANGEYSLSTVLKNDFDLTEEKE